ncbi:glomulin, FKBP associated protein b isoform X1 [Takifugu flavidus]|uniref:glomulin, FKBP associated protein b isoform X1 n=1 Tax=Takifugu flavidus TaxID=433684 RepID=UPI002544691A|nr:glomulin, FKBP associated protein b isoform X1 [Takifugu flavidus]
MPRGISNMNTAGSIGVGEQSERCSLLLKSRPASCMGPKCAGAIRTYARCARNRMCIHPKQSTPDEDLKPEDYLEFKRLGSACLAEGASAQLQQFLEDKMNQGFVQSMGCALLEPLLNEVVRKEKSSHHCQAAITQLTRICSPNDLVHNFLEIIEDIGPSAISETILIVIPHLQAVLFRLQDRQAASMGLVLSGLQKQLSRLPVPYSSQQEEADEYGLCRCCSALAAFIKPFTEGVMVTMTSGNPAHEEMKTELRNFCMRSLRDPLLDAELNQKRKSTLWHFASEIMRTLHAIHESLSELLFFASLRKRTKTDNIQSKESTACVAYLLFVQRITIDRFPAVFSPVFVLQCNMEHISLLLSSKKESHVLKGMALYKKSLEDIPDCSIPVSLLELQSVYHASQNLRRILTDCPLQHLRESGLQVFQLVIQKFNAEAKHKYFRCMLRTSNHAGLEGYIIKNIRNQVEFSIQSGHACAWFLGEGLVSLLGLVLCLPQGADTDLLNNMDRVMESLNLIRYLALRDNILRDAEGVWGEVCRLKDKYLTILRVCISLSRTCYCAEVKSLREGQKQKAKEAKDATRATRLMKSMNVKHSKVSSISPEVHYQVLQSALVTFDLMESLIVRIEEIATERLKKPQLN